MICATLIFGLAQAQITMRPILKKSVENFRNSQQNQEAISLPFWDDFSTSGTEPDTLWEFSNGVTIAESLALNPPTYKAATLDGIDSLGQVYDDQDNFSGLTDQLISRRIDLSALVGDESIYLSFFWEAGGNAERPEDPGDSLRLQMLNSDSLWVTVWKKHAIDLTTTEEFEQEIMQVQAAYRHKDFRFKFETFGSQFGPFDSWHIDYVYMDNDLDPDDLNIDDQALTGSVSSLISPYREMPAEHFFVDPSLFIVPQAFQSFDLLNQVAETLTMTAEYRVSTQSGTVELVTFQDVLDLEGQEGVNYDTLDANNDGAPDDPVTLSAISPVPDSAVIALKLSSNFTDDYPVNDTIRDSYLFHNYYAYDDGKPEFAAGVAQNGSVILQYLIPTSDDLTHIDIYFPTISPSPVGKTVEIQVWRNKNEQEPVRKKNFTITEADLDDFTRISLSSPLMVTDTVYIGYKQKSVEFLGIGLDKNNQQAKSKMYYFQNSWVQNETVNGILMIRPVFGEVLPVPLQADQKALRNFYPNPVKNILTINEEYSLIKIWNMNGQLEFVDGRQSKHDLSSLKAGLYVIEIIDQDHSNRALLRKD